MSKEPCKILYVEDNLDNQILFTYYFKKEPYDVTFSENGDEALNQVAQNDYQLILLDWNIPGALSGTELISALREKSGKQELPIVIITAHTKADGFDNPESLGVNDIIFKPAKKDQLLKLFRTFCGR